MQEKSTAAEKRESEKREAEKLEEEARASERAKREAIEKTGLMQQHSLLARRDTGDSGMFDVDMRDAAADAGVHLHLFLFHGLTRNVLFLGACSQSAVDDVPCVQMQRRTCNQRSKTLWSRK